jgi:hypothetical protein
LTRLGWDSIGDHVYERGVDRGVLYVDGLDGVAWNGLITVSEKPSGGHQPYYIDGSKFNQDSASEDFDLTIDAFTYPSEFESCEGIDSFNTGLYLTSQPRKSFGFSYRTLIGNDTSSDAGYKIHIVYNAMAMPTGRNNLSESSQVNPLIFSWDVQTVPIPIPGFKSTSHIVIDSRVISGPALSGIEDILYGSGSTAPRIPTVSELSAVIDVYAGLLVIDYGDGTANISGVSVVMIDANTYTINWPSVVEIDANTYKVTTS